MNITNSIWKDQTSILLENKDLRAVVLPGLGGKIASLVKTGAGFEFAAQPSGAYTRPVYGSSFSEHDASGLDDGFPCLHPCTDHVSGWDYPDHGEIWSAEMDASIREDSVELRYESPHFPYYYQKNVSISENKLILKYHIANISDKPFPCIWAFHGLMRYDEDMRILYPPDSGSILNTLDSPLLGPAGRRYLIARPSTVSSQMSGVSSQNKTSGAGDANLSGETACQKSKLFEDNALAQPSIASSRTSGVSSQNRTYSADDANVLNEKACPKNKLFDDNTIAGAYDFSSPPAAMPPTMVKYYLAEPVKNGYCGFWYPRAGAGCLLRYDPAILPYLGVWITAGGFRGDYNCALEPSNGFYDDINTARQNGSLYILKPDLPLVFTLTLEIVDNIIV